MTFRLWRCFTFIFISTFSFPLLISFFINHFIAPPLMVAVKMSGNCSYNDSVFWVLIIFFKSPNANYFVVSFLPASKIQILHVSLYMYHYIPDNNIFLSINILHSAYNYVEGTSKYVTYYSWY